MYTQRYPSINRVKLYQICNVITLFQSSWLQREFRLVPTKSIGKVWLQFKFDLIYQNIDLAKVISLRNNNWTLTWLKANLLNDNLLNNNNNLLNNSLPSLYVPDWHSHLLTMGGPMEMKNTQEVLYLVPIFIEETVTCTQLIIEGTVFGTIFKSIFY